MQARREVERHSEAMLRGSKEREVLMNDKASLVVQLTASERENRALAEELAGLRYSKDKGPSLQADSSP